MTRLDQKKGVIAKLVRSCDFDFPFFDYLFFTFSLELINQRIPLSTKVACSCHFFYPMGIYGKIRPKIGGHCEIGTVMRF